MIRKFKRGDKFKNKDGLILIVIASEDNYVMARNKGCYPFVNSYSEFSKRIADFEPLQSIKTL